MVTPTASIGNQVPAVLGLCAVREHPLQKGPANSNVDLSWGG